MSFIFDGQQLSDFGYIEFSEGVKSENLAVSTMTYETVKSALSDISYKVNHVYESNYSTILMIMKSPCEDLDEMWMTEDDISVLTRWLVRKTYKWFKYTDSNVWYKVQNTVEKIYEGENVIGLAITVNANAPFGFTPEIVNKWSDDEIIINVVTDEEGYIAPNFTIKANESGNLMIRNVRTGENTEINNVNENEIINIYGEGLYQITSSVSSHNIADDFNYVFPKLYSTYNNNANTIITNLDCDITMTYRGRRKVGL